MKILFVCSEPSPGMLPFAIRIINCVKEVAGLEVFALVALKAGQQKPEDMTGERVKTTFVSLPHHRILKLAYKFYPRRILRAMDHIVKSEGITYVSFLSGDFTLGRYAGYFASRVKLLYTVHDLSPHPTYHVSQLTKLMAWYIVYGCRKNMQKAPVLLTSSRGQYEELRKRYPDKQIFYHNFPSLVTEKISSGQEVCPELASVDHYILFFGNVDVYKGVELLYRVFQSSERLNEKYKLVIAGMGDWYFQRNMAEEQNIIRINRFIQDAEIKSLFSKAVCVVYPYQSVTQSGVLSLAYYFGTPVVASDVAYFREHVEDGSTGLLFRNGDARELSEKLFQLLENNSLRLEIKNRQQEMYDNLYAEQVLKEQFQRILGI